VASVLREGWEEKTLKEITSHLGDGLHGTPKYTDNGEYYFVNGNNLNDGKIIFKESTKRVSLEEYEKYKKNLTDRTILVSINGTLGNVAFYNNEKIVLGKSACYFNLCEGIDKNFIKYILISPYFLSYAHKEATGATIKNVSLKTMRELKINLPPFQEQKRIVAILDEAFSATDKAKANAELNLQNAKELFESYLQGIFENKGTDWKEESIKNLTELVTKGSSPKWQGISYVDEGGIFFLTSKNVGEGKLLLSNKKYLEEKFNDIQKTSILKKGDVLTNIVGASIGRTAIYDLNEITNINQAVCLMRCLPEKIYNYYLMYLLNSPFFKKILHDNEVDNARANLSLTFFKNLLIPLPPLTEQKEIVKKINLFSSETKKLESIYTQKLQDLEELKKSILEKAFNGEL
jgi:type I restriction enzyme S subunit